MKFKDYIEGLKKLASDQPEVLDLEVITSKDDEGNGYYRVHYPPSVGHFDGESFGSFVTVGQLEEEPEEFEGIDFNLNAVCVN